MAAVPAIIGGMHAFSTLVSVGQARAQGEVAAQAATYNARALEGQARAAGQQAGAAEELQRRQAREAFGKARAGGAEMGLLESGSFADAYSQAATEAELDALNIRYEGEMRRRGLLSEAAASRYEAKAARASRPTWFQGILSSGTQAAAGGMQSYGMRQQGYGWFSKPKG